MQMTPCACAIALAFTVCSDVLARTDDETPLPPITVSSDKPSALPPSADSAALLNDQPGYATAAGGGVSALPVLNGFAADRLKIRLDGMEVTAACGNQMNAPMSYMPPAQVGMTRVIAGITPVSVGGDSIGGSIELSSPAPQFAAAPGQLLTKGGFAVSARSVNAEVSASLNATVASDSLSVAYVASQSRAESYVNGNGDKVLSSLYQSNNHALTVAARGEGQQLVVKVGQQYIPYQGFPNEYMDMTGNRSTFANLGYERRFDWGKLFGRLYWQRTEHEMGFFSGERSGTMPMQTQGRDLGYTLRADIDLAPEGRSVLRVGHEYHSFHLDDVWPPVPGSMMMGPRPYLNINDGKRDRLALFAEWEQQLDARWSTLVGVRDELVKSDAGNVQSYGTNMMNQPDLRAANAFNARGHARTDNNIDLTALARWAPDAGKTYEFGYARKTRSPNLYERYTWGRGGMAMRMTNWFGDGNGYVGNLDLKPEVAHTLSGTADWHSEQREAGAGSDGGGEARWFFRLTPYFSYVENYIDADVIGSFNPYGVAAATGRYLQFANHDARLYGINASWKWPLAVASGLGEVSFTGKAGIARGKRVDGGNLYHMMPFHVLAALEHKQGPWTQRAEMNYVARKTQVDSNRVEPVTASYTVFNLRSSYRFNAAISVTAGISNLFNRNYAEPLGGVYLSGLAKSRSGALQALPGYGRSLDVGVNVSF
ncbi:TonB-dependent receptor [Herbaspirillum rubrisubalbicans]|uniref:TonB-dependent receptor n=1 Tax=Herbaspirillum rubrisubalbicans TaxID=80842 RepID=A0ABX9C4F7_9BURK|nr:TonB-dependent receptor [Herbaspirillum rubrisubalbicans]RAM65434.1 TonB-dependent receptor [Herbaspirillum rubrisubalbicans]RAN45986.1 TonB-dependent receptor [Herbaspirillum rubrisubalbicans]